MDVSAAIYVAVTGPGMYATPKDTIVDYQRGFLYIAVRVVVDCTVGNRAQGSVH
jgi:hypothetical protein